MHGCPTASLARPLVPQPACSLLPAPCCLRLFLYSSFLPSFQFCMRILLIRCLFITTSHFPSLIHSSTSSWPLTCHRSSAQLSSAQPSSAVQTPSMAASCSTHVFATLPRRPLLQRHASSSSSVLTSTDVADHLVRLGQSPVYVSPIGIGAWSWGDRLLWNNTWDEKNIMDSRDAFNVSMDNGLTFFDTAEVYGSPQWAGGDDSESLLGRAIKDRERRSGLGTATVATKFAALPWRFSRRSVVAALRDSLFRLGLPSIELYQLHWPGLWGNEGFIDGLGDAVEQGLVKAVGVSNYNEKRLRAAHDQLSKRGIALASNQVHYSLIYRYPEENNVKKTCDELGVTLIAYSPLGQGVLSGKYSASNLPAGPRGRTYNAEFLTKAAPLLSKMREIGNQYGKSPTQVALNWLLLQGNVVPIPGAKSASQAQEFAGALGWSLSEDEERELRYLATKVKPVVGFPAESF
ncbi:hypothetical protein M758_11G160500 [Ceratodon purpureus]|nr:hypothetical protein M758_11G160500 [Ceratodon purpureus]